jgi:penicillin-binding protein 2
VLNPYSDRKNTISGIFIIVGLLFVIRLFYIQIVEDYYRNSADNNSRRYVVQYPDRGTIFDRKGVDGTLLVSNIPAYDLLVVPKLTQDFDTTDLCQILNVPKSFIDNELAKAKNYSEYKPSVIVRNISTTTYARLQEKLFKFPGFSVQPRSLRAYPLKTAAHVLGYVGEVDEKLMASNSYYKMGDYIGLSGIEKTYEKYLRGKKGVNIFLVDVHSRIQGNYKNGQFDTAAVGGSYLVSTLDADLQILGEKLMQHKKGSIVAIEPSTGEILALISNPSYDPNLLVGRERTKNYATLLKNDLKPLFNRALMAQYPPGSTFKLINALIGLQEGVITPESRFSCAGGYNVGGFHLGCHHYSSFDLISSIQSSCNAYYCNVFRRIIDNRAYNNPREGYIHWRKHVLSFGLGQKMETDFSNELKGIIPSELYFDKKYGGTNRWNSMTLVSMSIGQGEVGVTPLQMCNMTAAIANRGFYFIPHMVRRIEGKQNIDPRFTTPRYTTIDQKYFEPIVEGMERVVLAGTATSARFAPISICGKTGTAQNPHGKDHSIFVAFAPKDKPKIAIAVYVENAGFGATYAAPIASLLIEQFINGKISRKELEERMTAIDLMDPGEATKPIAKKDSISKKKNH